MEATINPTLSELQRLIDKVPRYPLSISQLLKIAKEKGASSQVRHFYQKFANDRVFTSRKDLLNITEQVEIMRSSRRDMPLEQPMVPIED
jgi:hypothetical protein